MNDAKPDISLVVPSYNEAENLPTLIERITQVFGPAGKPFEAIIIDDGSTDETPSVLRELKKDRPWLRVLCMDANRGQTAALDAGFHAARGEIVATLDADLQNDPADILAMVPLLADCDAVTGWRVRRRDPWLRRVSTRVANAVRNRVLGESVHDSACSLKVYRRACLEGLTLFDGLHRFMPALMRMRGFRVREVPVSHAPRRAGKAKYGVWNRLFRALRDLLAVRWMQRRRLAYHASEMENAETPKSRNAERNGRW